jgi:hypothetical protein
MWRPTAVSLDPQIAGSVARRTDVKMSLLFTDWLRKVSGENWRTEACMMDVQHNEHIHLRGAGSGSNFPPEDKDTIYMILTTEH